jgi:type II secretory pathway pseudopilin PulG
VNRRAKRTVAAHGFLLLEAIISTGLMIVLVAVFAAATVQYAAVRRENDTRRLLRLAAAAELDLIRAGLHPIPDAQPQQAPSQPGEIAIRVSATDGDGVWRGLTCVRVTASKPMAGGRTLAVELVTYIAGETGP